MRCPSCQRDSMDAALTTSGVELDRCRDCGSVWLDRGELFFFVRNLRAFDAAIAQARQAALSSELASPSSEQPMVQITMPGGAAGFLDRETGGVWLPGQSVSKLGLSGDLIIKWQAEARTEPTRFRLPNLISRTIFTMTGLYALLSVVLISISLAGGMSAGGALLIAALVMGFQFLVGPFFMDLWLGWAYQARRVSLEELPEHLQLFVRKTSAEHRMKTPRFKIIPDLSPNAFTYGHTPQNARIVLTEGMFELLDKKELEGVVGHEMGHARNWDMALMTFAQLVPLVLYYLYRTAAEVDPDDGRAKAASTAVAIGAYVLYMISIYIVLWFSRTREYHADRFGARAVGSPAALARALVKIGYGLASRGGEAEKGKARGGRRAAALGGLGIFDAGAAQSLALVTASRDPQRRPRAAACASCGAPVPEAEARFCPGCGAPVPLADAGTTEGGADEPARYHIDGGNLKGAMKWDLWNPWAFYFELHSTHPLIAKRILALSTQSEEISEQPLVRFDLPKPESYWDEFLVDFSVMAAPTLLFIATVIGASLTGRAQTLGAGLIVVAAGMMLKLRFTYPTGAFPEMSVATLLRQVKVSGIRSVPCRLEGTVRGRGVPGLLWSEDFVMQDPTGIIFLDHRQPLAIWEAIWGWLRGGKLVGRQVVVDGWFRRAPVPFVELKTFTVDGVKRTSWLRHFRWAWALLVAAAGVLVLVAGSGVIP